MCIRQDANNWSVDIAVGEISETEYPRKKFIEITTRDGNKNRWNRDIMSNNLEINKNSWPGVY